MRQKQREEGRSRREKETNSEEKKEEKELSFAAIPAAWVQFEVSPR